MGLGRRSGKEVWRDAVPHAAGGLVLDLCEKLIDGYARRRGPMPVVVVHATREEPQRRYDDRARETVDLVHRAQKPRWLLCRRLDPPADRTAPPGRPPGGPPYLDARTYAATTALIKDIAEGPWENHNRCQYRPYRMPRSRLMAALDQALEEAGAGGQRPDSRAVVARLAELRWRPGGGRTGLWRTMAGLLSPATAMGAVIVACVGVLANKLGGWYLTGLVLGVLLALAARYRARNWAGPPWLGAGCRWFATTTFPVTPSREAPVWSPRHPRLSRATLEERAAEVARQLLTAAGPGEETPAAATERERARQFCLQLRTLALLEDLRDNHRPAWDLRHRKRTVPPLLLLPRASRANGALPFLRAVSDVRSRRSEQDPLLIVAGVAHEDLADLREHTPLPLPALVSGTRDPAELYQAWVTRSLRTGQAPSMNTALPWLMPVALGRRLLTPYESYDHPEIRHRSTCRVPRSGWLLWSRWTLVAACVLATTGAGTSYGYLNDRYCGDVSVFWNRDLVRMPDGQCVGVVSGERLDIGPGAVSLDAGGQVVDLRRLQDAIRAENARIAGEEHITLLFAGALTTLESDPAEATDVVRQLAGVYLAQRLINDSGATNRLPKVRIVIATGGQGLTYQKRMAERIVDYARRHPDVVGVVGMGINTAESDAAVGLLQRAGLPVIGTTNSATELAHKYHNYVGLAPTDHEEAMLLVRSLGAADGREAVVLRPDDGGEPGRSYTADHARYGRAELADAGFAVRNTLTYRVDGTEAKTTDAVRRICERRIPVVYLAGRAGHIPSLLADLEENPDCADHHDDVVVLTGDEATKRSYTGDRPKMPAGTRLRYAALTDERHLAGADLYEQAREEFAAGFFRPGKGKRPGTAGSVQDDGFLALSHDAVLAFHTVARTAGVPESGGAPVVLAALHATGVKGATGNIGFRDADHKDPQARGHGIGLYQVSKADENAPLEPVYLCGRPAGGTPSFRELCSGPDPA